MNDKFGIRVFQSAFVIALFFLLSPHDLPGLLLVLVIIGVAAHYWRRFGP